MNTTISADFPFESKYLNVKGSNMHYIDEGEGDPILFLHGNPTSSYLWRNVIPHLEGQARLIAPDLIGMGKSDKPNIDYTYDDHYAYLEAFIEKLGLKNVTLVIHDWGSALGFRYAHTHVDNIKGITFMEAIVKPMSWSEMPADMRTPFKMMRTPYVGWFMISVMNMFVNKMIPDTIKRTLNAEEMAYYRAPYPTIKSRKPVRVWPQQIPIDGKPKRNQQLIESYSQWLQDSNIPKLCLYSHPGAIINAEYVQWIEKRIPNTKMVDIGEGIHFVQEDNPHGIGKAISEWYGKI